VYQLSKPNIWLYAQQRYDNCTIKMQINNYSFCDQ